jgi:hypothetical protein
MSFVVLRYLTGAAKMPRYVLSTAIRGEKIVVTTAVFWMHDQLLRNFRGTLQRALYHRIHARQTVDVMTGGLAKE